MLRQTLIYLLFLQIKWRITQFRALPCAFYAQGITLGQNPNESGCSNYGFSYRHCCHRITPAERPTIGCMPAGVRPTPTPAVTAKRDFFVTVWVIVF